MRSKKDVSHTEIGQLLKESREKASYATKGLVGLLKKKGLKISVGTWHNVEHGRRLPDEPWLEQFANLPRMSVKLEDLRAALYRDELRATLEIQPPLAKINSLRRSGRLNDVYLLLGERIKALENLKETSDRNWALAKARILRMITATNHLSRYAIERGVREDHEELEKLKPVTLNGSEEEDLYYGDYALLLPALIDYLKGDYRQAQQTVSYLISSRKLHPDVRILAIRNLLVSTAMCVLGKDADTFLETYNGIQEIAQNMMTAYEIDQIGKARLYEGLARSQHFLALNDNTENSNSYKGAAANYIEEAKKHYETGILMGNSDRVLVRIQIARTAVEIAVYHHVDDQTKLAILFGILKEALPPGIDIRYSQEMENLAVKTGSPEIMQRVAVFLASLRPKKY